MSKAKYSEELKAVLDEILLKHSEITAAKVFGLPCYKYNGVIFATIHASEVGIKLAEARVSELLKHENCKPFQPFGRNRGKQFVAITHDNVQQFTHDEDLLLESARYVAGKIGSSSNG
jgi:hypothetical protein